MVDKGKLKRSNPASRPSEPSGRVARDERGNASWQWSSDGESPTARVKRLGLALASDPIREAVATLLDQLAQLDDRAAASVAALKTELREAPTDAAVAQIIVRASESVRERLDELTVHLAGSTDGRQSGFADAHTLKTPVSAHVRKLADKLRSAASLIPPCSVVNETLEAVVAQVQDLRSDEGSRSLEDASRTGIMRLHIGKLERETRNLHVSLHEERSRARLDSLTGIANRTSFAERLADEVVRSSRLRAPASLLLWDIDRFKAINDTYGHRAGDTVLRAVAKCLALGKRASDYVSRVGGEEFVILLPDTQRSEALCLAETLRRNVQALKFQVRGTPVQVTVSCGVTEFIDADTADSVFDRADAALYRAKNSGRNRCIAA